MIPKALAMLAAHSGLFSAERLRAARTLREFDDVFTAPLHGYRDADDYYTRASSQRFLAGIRVPTLLISARNDPFLPGRYLPAPGTLPADVRAIFTESGGHAGFCSGPPPGRFEWAPAALIDFFVQTTSARHAATEGNIQGL
jgi:predicted alpha/beta-fold hydrolase